MSARVHRIVVTTLAIMILGGTATGCSKFRSSQRLHLNPFAEDMIALAGDIQYGLGRLQPVHLQGYMDVPELHDYDRLGAKLRGTLRGSISYSIQVVTLGESDHTGPEQAGLLADYMDGLLRSVLEAPVPELHLSVEQFDTILADVRAAPELLAALRAAQPVIDEVARASGELFDQAATALEVVSAAIGKNVDADFAEVFEQDRWLRQKQLSITANIALLTSMYEGDVSAVDSLRSNLPSVAPLLEQGTLPEAATIRDLEQRLVYMLQAISDVRAQLQPDLIRYREAKRELGLLKNEFAAALRKGRVAMMAWARAHGRLAAGVTDPAEIDILGIARKAAGDLVVPF